LRHILAILIPALALAQDTKPALRGPSIGIIDYYGVRKMPLEALRKALGLAVGDPLPKSKGDVEERLEAIPGVVRARLEATCCEDSKIVLYVGIEEKGAPTFNYRPAPTAHIDMPEEILTAYKAFLEEVAKAVTAGQAAEDLTRGHSLLEHPGARAIQLRFTEMAKAHLKTLRDVLRESEHEEDRAIAAYVIGYAPDKKAVVNDLQFALQDPDDAVRNHALRGLTAMEVLAMREPESGIPVSPTWFVEMLHSLIWTDRNNAAVALVTLTENRDQKTLDLLRERVLPELKDMARWRHLPHALPACILLGRVAGMREEEIQDAWNKGERERVISAARAPATRKSAPTDRR
jgi:hypothetical protein